MIVYFSTVVREAAISEGGEVVKLDWDRKEVLARHPIVPTNPAVSDPNPRGGTRGGRGILVDARRVLVASYHTLHAFDHDLNPVSEITNPLFSNLHELSWDGDDIWVTSTAIDAAVKIDGTGATLDAWWPRDDRVTRARFGLAALELDKDADHRVEHLRADKPDPSHCHLNAVAVTEEGRPLVLLNRKGCVIGLRPTEILISDERLAAPHNIVLTRPGHILINNSRGRTMEVYEASGKHRRTIELTETAVVKRILRRHAWTDTKIRLVDRGRPFRLWYGLFSEALTKRPIFVRGLCELPNGHVLVGISPAAILEFDVQTGELTDHFLYSNDLGVCVHGLCHGG